VDFKLVELFCIFSGFLGLILFFIILFKLKGKLIVKASLAMFLLTISAIVIIGTITFSGNIVYFPHLFRLDSPLHYLFGPVCFFYTLSSFKTDFRFRPVQLLNLLPFIINLIEFTPFYFSGASAKIELYNSILKTGTLILPLHTIFKTTLILIYLILQLYIFYKYKTQNISGNKSQRSLITWFTIFLSEQAILLVGLFLNIISEFKLFADPYSYAILVESFYVYSATIALLFFPELLYGKTADEKNTEIIPKEKYLHSKLSEDDKLNILNDLKSFLRSESNPFLNPALTLVEVAKIIKVTPQELSQVVNEKTNLNFTNYINSYRIEKAKEILTSHDFSKLTIDSIAEMAGFQSKSPFYLAFKKHTGMTPKEFVVSQNK